MRTRILKKILPLLLILCFSLIQADDAKISPILKNMILNSDQIVTGTMESYTSEVQGHKSIYKGLVKIEDIISSDC